MPRTAKTLAITHDGKDVLLAGPTVNLLEQRDLVKKIRSENGGARFHADYASLSYQESDGHETVYRFSTPAAHEERQKQVAEDNAAQEEQNKAHRALEKKTPGAPALPKPDEENAPEDDDELALGESEKAEGLRKELLAKSRGELLKLAETTQAKLPLLKGKVAIVDAILAAGYPAAPTE